MNCFCARTHDNDDSVCIWSTNIFINLIVTSSHSAKFIHSFLNDFWSLKIIWVNCFTTLEVNVWVLSSTTNCWFFWVQTASSVSHNQIVIYHSSDGFVINCFDFIYFVRSSETIEEVHKWNAGFKSSCLSDKSKVVSFLN